MSFTKREEERECISELDCIIELLEQDIKKIKMIMNDGVISKLELSNSIKSMINKLNVMKSEIKKVYK